MIGNERHQELALVPVESHVAGNTSDGLCFTAADPSRMEEVFSRQNSMQQRRSRRHDNRSWLVALGKVRSLKGKLPPP